MATFTSTDLRFGLPLLGIETGTAVRALQSGGQHDRNSLVLDAVLFGVCFPVRAAQAVISTQTPRSMRDGLPALVLAGIFNL